MLDKHYQRANQRSSLRPITALRLRSRHTLKRNYVLKALLCTRIAFLHTRVTRKSIMDLGGAVRNERKHRARVEFRCFTTADVC